MRETLYRYRYLLLGIILAAIVGQITFEYSRAKSHIDLEAAPIGGQLFAHENSQRDCTAF